jgi:hypothetical protein
MVVQLSSCPLERSGLLCAHAQALRGHTLHFGANGQARACGASDV